MKAHTTTAPAAGPVSVEQLQAELALSRELESARRADELARIAAQAEHEAALADVAERVHTLKDDRAERVESRSADAKLSRFFLEARDAGERARVSAHMARSGEVRTMRLVALRPLNVKVLFPAFLAFGALSTTGVQQGMARMSQAHEFSPTWWALWLLEPALLTIVGWQIFFGARLAGSGGALTKDAKKIMWSALGTSIALNLIASAPSPGAKLDSVGAVLAVLGVMFSHALAPVVAACVAHLIGENDKAITTADPLHENGIKLPTLDDLKLDLERHTTPATTITETPSSDQTDIAPAADIATDISSDMSVETPVSAPRTTDTDPAPLPVHDSQTDMVPSLGLESVRDLLALLAKTGDAPVPASTDDLWNEMPQVNAPDTDTTETDQTTADDDDQDGDQEEKDAADNDHRRRLADMLLVKPDLTGPQIGAVLGVSARHGLRLKKEVFAAAASTPANKINGHRFEAV